MNKANLTKLINIALSVVNILRTKDPKYGSSWKSKGGFSAFFNLDRKWSRVENLARQYNYDVFAAYDATEGEPDCMHEALGDLVGYALLILTEKSGFSGKDLTFDAEELIEATRYRPDDDEVAAPRRSGDPRRVSNEGMLPKHPYENIDRDEE